MKNKEIIVGAFSVIVLTMLYFGFNYLKGIDFFTSKNTFYAKYDNISQLTVSNPVLVNGFAVGRVSAIHLMPQHGNRVLVELEIDSDVIVGKGAKATLYSDFLGSKSILLDIGKGENPLKDRDTIQSEIAKGMMALISETAEPVADNIATTLRKLNTMMDSLSSNMDEIGVIFKKLKSTPDKINTTFDTATETMKELGGNVKEIKGKVNQTLGQLDPTLKNFQTISDSLKVLKLNETLLKAQATLGSITDVVNKLKSGDNSASKLLASDSLYTNLDHLMKSIDSLAVHFNTHPKHFLGPLGKSSKKIERDHQKDLEKKKSK